MEPGFEAFTVLIARLSRSVKRLKTGEMAEFDLKGPHVSCLYYLSREEGLTAVELCERCDEDKAAISRSLDFLEKNGYISCDSTARKRYRSPLRLTDKGRAVCRRMDEKIDRIASQAGEGLSPGDREIMYRALTLLCGNLERLCREERALARPHPPTKGE